MKVYLSSTFLLSLVQLEKKDRIKNLLLSSIESNTRFFTSVFSIHTLFLKLSTIELEQKRMILRNLEDLTDEIFSLSMDEIRSELLLTEGLGLEQVIALNQGMDFFYEYTKENQKNHPLLKIRNFFWETE